VRGQLNLEGDDRQQEVDDLIGVEKRVHELVVVSDDRADVIRQQPMKPNVADSQFGMTPAKVSLPVGSERDRRMATADLNEGWKTFTNKREASRGARVPRRPRCPPASVADEPADHGALLDPGLVVVSFARRRRRFRPIFEGSARRHS
jgi:hypothetical protein